MFINNVYSLNSFILYEYFFKNNFKLFIFNNQTQIKDDWKNSKKFNKYIQKSILTNWVRVVFRGKGFRLRKFKEVNKLTFNFGHSHWTKMGLNLNKFFFKKLKRQNYICLIKNYACFKSFTYIIKYIKNLNVYTKRGLRLKKQYIKRRFGKISQVVSSLH